MPSRSIPAPHRLAMALAFALSSAGAAMAQTLAIDADQTATVVLPAAGGSADVLPGVRIAPTAGAGIETEAGNPWRIANDGDIASAPSGAGTLDGIRFASGGALDNRGSVRATHFGVVANGSLDVRNARAATIAGATGLHFNVAGAGDGALLVNDGTIRGVGAGVGASGTGAATQTVSVDNRGRIEATNGAGVRITHGGAGTARTASVVNRSGATILGGAGSSAVVSVHGLTRVVNEAGATLQGGVSGVYAQEAFSFLDIDNAGAIVGGSAAGIRAYGGGTVHNRAGATIAGAGGVSFVRSVQSTENVLRNAGTITGDATTFVAGAGPTAGAGAGVYIGGASDAVGVRIENSGTIDGVAYGLYSGAALQATDPGPVTVHNAGAIAGDIGIALHGDVGTVANAGMIEGRNGIAIRFDQAEAFANTLVLQTGSILRGDVHAGPGAANALVLEGSGADTGDKLQGFATLAMRGSAWAFDGNATFGDHIALETGRFDLAGQLRTPRVRVHAGATLAGSGTVIGNIDNAGTLAPGGATFGTLTLRGNYTGTGAATFAFDTQLGDDASPTDRIVFDGGSAQGHTRVVVANSGGTGAATGGHGIRLIEAIGGATTTDDAFSMTDPLRIGAFDYRLFRGGLAGHDAQSWYLRSEFIVGPPSPPPPQPPPPPPEPKPPVLPVDPPPPELPPGRYPIVGPQLATHGVVQPLARALGAMALATLHERRGDGFALAHDNDATAWARAFGASLDHRYRAFVDPHVRGDVRGLQAGFDPWRDARDRIGVFATRGEIDADVAGFVTDAAATRYVAVPAGRVGLRGTAVGATWTHGGDAWYVDTVLQAMRFDGQASTTSATLALRGDATMASVEAGRAWAFAPDIVIEPQLQLAWQGASFEERSDRLGRIALNATRGVTARVGARARWHIASSADAIWMPWVRVNVRHDHGGLAETHYDARDVVPLRFGGTRMDIGAGVSAQWSAAAVLFASIDHTFAIDVEGDRRFQTQATAGVQIAW